MENYALNNQQYLFLKSVYHKPKTVQYLADRLGCCPNEFNVMMSGKHMLFEIDGPRWGADAIISLTPDGEYAVEHERSNRMRYRVPLIVSIVALLFSILSIVLSPFFSAYFSYLFGL